MDRERLFGGNPLAVIIRLIVVSVVVGIVLSALNIDPSNIFYHVRLLIQRIYDMGFGIFESAVRYFLLGAAIVVPIWLVMRMFGMFRSGRDRDRG
jgi:hypothetical protein